MTITTVADWKYKKKYNNINQKKHCEHLIPKHTLYYALKASCDIACAIYSSCDCFLTTDDRLFKYNTSEIQMLNPIDFIRRLEGDFSG